MPGERLGVLLVVDSLEAGGAERHVVDLARALGRRGHDVTVACSVAGPLAGELVDADVRVEPLVGRRIKRRFSPSYAAALRGLLAAGRFTVVHAHIHASATAAADAVGPDGLPLVITDHTEAPWMGSDEHAAAARAYRRAGHVIAVSRPIRRRALREFGLPPAKVSYVPNAVMPQETPTVKRSAGVPLIGRVCRLAPEKGVDVFLHAAARVADRIPSARFVVAGDGPLAAELRALAGALGLDGRIEFTGHSSTARELIGRLDVLAVSSHSEGSPLVTLEAMMAGVPVVAGACGGLTDQIRHGQDGLLVEAGDSVALGDALLRVVTEPGLARRLGGSARGRARSAFSYPAMVDAVESRYRAVAAR
jgi:glycosyltransferase involved in cell wall biosynthesis